MLLYRLLIPETWWFRVMLLVVRRVCICLGLFLGCVFTDVLLLCFWCCWFDCCVFDGWFAVDVDLLLVICVGLWVCLFVLIVVVFGYVVWLGTGVYWIAVFNSVDYDLVLYCLTCCFLCVYITVVELSLFYGELTWLGLFIYFVWIMG